MTAKHTFEESSNPLEKLEYIPLLDAVLNSLKEKNIFKFSPDGNKLLIEVYESAYKIATKKDPQLQSPLSQYGGIKAATVNFSSETEFYAKISEIKDELKKHLLVAFKDEKVKNLWDNNGYQEVKDSLNNICRNLSDFNSKERALPFSYPFEVPYHFTSQRLTVENSSVSERRAGSYSAIKAHLLNVRFTGLSQFDNQLFESLKNYIADITTPDSEDWKDLTDILNKMSAKNKSEQSELTEIRKIVDTESLPRLLRDIKIDYLEYLKKECEKTNIPNLNVQGFECLETLINRLKLVINYINDPNSSDPDYEVSYLLDEPLNLRTAFSQANAFDMLPIIPEYEGVIGESVDRHKDIKEFNLGIRLKLNNSVNSYEEDSVLDYYMTEIDPSSQRHQEQLKASKYFKQKVLKIACLYYLIFAVDEEGKIADKDYNPIPKFKTDIINELQSDDRTEEQVKRVFAKVRDSILKNTTWKIKEKLEYLKQLLKNFLNRKEILPSFPKSVRLGINKAILHPTTSKIINTRNLFRIDLNKDNRQVDKASLAYVEVLPPTVNESSLTSLSVTFTFDDVRYFPDGEKQGVVMKYDIASVKTLPVVFSPIIYNPNTQKWENTKIYTDNYKSAKLIAISYRSKQVREKIFNNTQSPESRIYRQVFTLLTYLCISICREQISLDGKRNEKLFIPLFRFHFQDVKDSTEDEEFLSSLSKALAHILRRDCLADAQGLNVNNFARDKYFDFRVKNALSSLYALLPKTFEFKEGYQPQLDKLAIIVVSSWLSDAVWNEQDKRISNIYGEVIIINQISATSVNIESIKTFSDNQPTSKMYSEPEIVRDEIAKLHQQGYQHFLYIAKAPYSRSLGITKLESDPNSLFFMAPEVVQYLKAGKPDIKLYPVFMDTYPAINLNTGKVDSFYIPDSQELEKLSKDKSQQTRVFLNLFTGRYVGKTPPMFNSVVCYSTLLNIYDVNDTKIILEGLLDKDSPLQQTILQYIILFHFSRYELYRSLALKLNPYSKLIGDEGIGTVSTYTYSPKNIKFNNLAFLTAIRSAMYGK